MADPKLAALIGETAAAITAAGARAAPPGAHPALAALFEALASEQDASRRAEAEDLIWALWTTHADDGLTRRMSQAIGALSRRELDRAAALLDALVLDAPGWAEAWNKRATVRFLLERDLESVRDIRRTVELEPRHFGAMSGFGQICLRAGDELCALVGFQAALKVNPGLDSVRRMAAALERRLRRTMH